MSNFIWLGLCSNEGPELGQGVTSGGNNWCRGPEDRAWTDTQSLHVSRGSGPSLHYWELIRSHHTGPKLQSSQRKYGCDWNILLIWCCIALVFNMCFANSQAYNSMQQQIKFRWNFSTVLKCLQAWLDQRLGQVWTQFEWYQGRPRQARLQHASNEPWPGSQPSCAELISCMFNVTMLHSPPINPWSALDGVKRMEPGTVQLGSQMPQRWTPLPTLPHAWCSLTSCQAPAIASSKPVGRRSWSPTGTLQRFLIK